MGAMHAAEYAALGDRTLGLTAHLQSNHFPPVPVSMVPVCEAAIDSCNAGFYGADIALPEGTTWRGQDHAPAHAIVTGHHLESWLDYGDDEDEDGVW